MEAMAAGLPVIATTVSGIPEIVRDGWSGRLTPPGDSEALASALRSLLGDAAARKRLATGARETVERGFNVTLEARRLRELLEGAIAGPSTAAAERRPA
jgi:glycosyltransferase involved in cell wall biosynthesis